MWQPGENELEKIFKKVIIGFKIRPFRVSQFFLFVLRFILVKKR